MNQADLQPFQRLIADMLAFYRQDASTFAVTVWWQACQPFDLDAVRKAITAHAMDPERGQFAPKPADVVRQLQGTFGDRSLLAWGKVYEAASRVGAYQSVVFDDPAIHSAIEDIGGWVTLCRTSADELPHVQRRFIASHKAYSSNPDARQHPRHLAGVHEIDNCTNGYADRTAPPLLIGDPARARLVYESGAKGGRTTVTLLEMTDSLVSGRQLLEMH